MKGTFSTVRTLKLIFHLYSVNMYTQREEDLVGLTHHHILAGSFSVGQTTVITGCYLIKYLFINVTGQLISLH